MDVWIRLICACLMAQIVVSCGSPAEEYRKEILRLGYIAYVSPLRYGSTGTILGGDPLRLVGATPPTHCFPETADGAATGLRFYDETDLPFIENSFYIEMSANVDLMKAVSAGTPSVTVKANISEVRGYTLEFSGARMEAINLDVLRNYYNNGMSEGCKDLLDNMGFVIQALKVDSMSFQFFDQKGLAIDLSLRNIEAFVDVGMGVTVKVTEKYRLDVTSPKYIGYHLGLARREDKGLSLYRATRLDSHNRYLFEKISNVPRSSTRALQLAPLPRNQLDDKGFVFPEELLHVPSALRQGL